MPFRGLTLMGPRNMYQLQQSGILPLLLFVRLKPSTLSENILKPIFSSLHLIAPSGFSSASDSFYWMIMALNQFFYFLTYYMGQGQTNRSPWCSLDFLSDVDKIRCVSWRCGLLWWFGQDGTVLVHTVKHGWYLRTLKPPHEKGRHVSIEKLAVSNTGQICVYCHHWLKSKSSSTLVSSVQWLTSVAHRQ